MKGDFSRIRFDKEKHYSGVLMQQGRVQVDADWNEQQAISQHRIETEALDVIGKCGAPMGNNAGFEITIAEDGKLNIGRGRYYVGGILCENDGDITYDKQPDLPLLPNDPTKAVDILRKANATIGLVYLDVWQRHITALDDPLIREVALSGPDTTTRVKTICQVKILPIRTQKSDPQKHEELIKEQKKLKKELYELQRCISGNVINEIKEGDAKLEKVMQEIARLSDKVTCDSQFSAWDELIKLSDGKLSAHTQPAEIKENLCLIPPRAGYQGQENQLYRVEIHRSGHLGTATFKWSRDNGSVVTAIEMDSNQVVTTQVVTVSDIGLDNVLGFAEGQWVEIVDDVTELNGEPYNLKQISKVDRATHKITLYSSITIDMKHHPKLRRWDSVGIAGEIPATNNGWIPIENGIEIQFSKGNYKTGDYWMIPARTATGKIEWPQDESKTPPQPVPQPPQGIYHHYCRLALIHIQREGKKLIVQDCRKLFPPLTEASAIHVICTNWSNDDIVPLDLERFIKDDLQITLDAEPVLLWAGSAIAAIIVTMEEVGISVSRGFSNRVILQGQNSVLSRTITWKPINAKEVIDWIMERKKPVLIRVTLKGHVIWSDQGGKLLYLDGQAFGRPDVRTNGEKPRTALIFPSGNGAQASDFESWFYLAPQTRTHEDSRDDKEIDMFVFRST